MGGDSSGVATATCSLWDDGSLDPQAELPTLVAHALIYEAAGANPWRCLGLVCGSAPEVVRKRYLHLARRLHPDKVGAESEEQAMANRTFAAVERAYTACRGE